MSRFILKSKIPPKGYTKIIFFDRIILDMAEKKIADQSVKCGNKMYNLPSNILHNEIHYFETIKKQNTDEEVIDVYPYNDTSTFELILQYHGHSPIAINNNNILQLVTACCHFGDNILLVDCCDFLETYISVKNLNVLIENREQYVNFHKIIISINSYCKKYTTFLLNDGIL